MTTFKSELKLLQHQGVKYSRGSYCHCERGVKINPRKLLQVYSKNNFDDQLLHDMNGMLTQHGSVVITMFFVPEHAHTGLPTPHKINILITTAPISIERFWNINNFKKNGLRTLANCKNEKYLVVEPETATFDKEYPGGLVLVAEEVT